ncbi:hypothetical protein [Lactococcus petauri]|uniref:hypothetical protein n=1 Tax=Lactococcus petauri TaxID=1940789 RepID=UPI003852ADDF
MSRNGTFNSFADRATPSGRVFGLRNWASAGGGGFPPSVWAVNDAGELIMDGGHFRRYLHPALVVNNQSH